ncbi:unnamed protein product [Phyllotreta striolata]|uniref:Uncharacterized protein n=1 Tax=Phyllotreta striolata TaxID=444603 RepID=A0A9N9XNW7_PHYSR|nr:unnamed protein product [Phyllotreta striolata]
MVWYSAVFVICVILIATKLYHLLTKGWCRSKVCLVGKTVLVTGSNRGIGFETALEFAKRGARVILACRNLEYAAEAKDKIISLTQNRNIVLKEVNLSSLKSIKNLADDINKTEDRLDILVNNAGIGIIKNKTTEDGLQILMQINYFAPVFLTLNLIDLLKKTGSSRIVLVSSMLAILGDLKNKNLNEYPGSNLKAYSNSKLALILFGRKLAKLLQGSGVSVYSLHPGVIKTNIFDKISKAYRTVFDVFVLCYFKTPEEGAQTTLHASLEPDLEEYSGGFFKECERTSFYRKARDDGLVDEVWQKTMDVLKIEKKFV